MPTPPDDLTKLSLAELAQLALLELPGLVVERLQLGIEIAGFAHRACPSLNNEDRPVIEASDQSQ